MYWLRSDQFALVCLVTAQNQGKVYNLYTEVIQYCMDASSIKSICDAGRKPDLTIIGVSSGLLFLEVSILIPHTQDERIAACRHMAGLRVL